MDEIELLDAPQEKTETEIAIERLESSLAFYESEVTRNQTMVNDIKNEINNLK